MPLFTQEQFLAFDLQSGVEWSGMEWSRTRARVCGLYRDNTTGEFSALYGRKAGGPAFHWPGSLELSRVSVVVTELHLSRTNVQVCHQSDPKGYA